jgi:hypothetical protein
VILVQLENTLQMTVITNAQTVKPAIMVISQDRLPPNALVQSLAPPEQKLCLELDPTQSLMKRSVKAALRVPFQHLAQQLAPHVQLESSVLSQSSLRIPVQATLRHVRLEHMPLQVLNLTSSRMKPFAPSALLENMAQQLGFLLAAAPVTFHVLPARLRSLALRLLINHSKPCVQAAQQVPFLHLAQKHASHVPQENMAQPLD